MDVGFLLQIFLIGGLSGFLCGLLVGLWLSQRGIVGRWTTAIFGKPTASRNNEKESASGKQGLPAAVNEVTQTMANAIASLPKIQEVTHLFSTLSNHEREKLSIPLSVEFAYGATQLTAQELEAITKLRELSLRFSLYISKVKLVAVSAPAELEAILDTVIELEAIATERTAKLKTPEWTGVSQAVQAQKATELLREVAHVPNDVIRDVTLPFLLPENTDSPKSDEMVMGESNIETPQKGHKYEEDINTYIHVLDDNDGKKLGSNGHGRTFGKR